MAQRLDVLIAFASRGRGHQSRCEALGAELHKLGVRVRFVKHPNLREASHPEEQFDAVVVDGSEEEMDHARWLRVPQKGKGLQVRIGDEALDVVCDFAFMPNPGCSENLWHGAKRVHAGRDWVMLRPIFRTLRGTGLPPGRRDPLGFIDLRPASSGRAGTGSAEEMARLMLDSNVVVCHGGQVALEAAAMGCAVVGVARNQGERFNLIGLRAADAALVSDDESAGVHATELAGNRRTVEKMGEAGMKLIDACGAERAARTLWTKLMP